MITSSMYEISITQGSLVCQYRVSNLPYSMTIHFHPRPEGPITLKEVNKWYMSKGPYSLNFDILHCGYQHLTFETQPEGNF